MNERIKELMVQSGFDPSAIERMGVMPQAEKFAKLIIEECITQCKKVEEHGENYIGGGPFADVTKLCRDAIEVYFGVEQ